MDKNCPYLDCKGFCHHKYNFDLDNFKGFKKNKRCNKKRCRPEFCPLGFNDDESLKTSK